MNGHTAFFTSADTSQINNPLTTGELLGFFSLADAPLRPLMPESLDRPPSSSSLNSVPEDDWDSSLPDNPAPTTPQNSIVFPVNETPDKSSRCTHSKNASVQDMENGKDNLTLSELLRLHSEKDSKGNFSAEEAARIADVLGQWVGVHSCPVLN